MENGRGKQMIETLKAALKHMQANDLPCSEVKLAIFLLEKVEDEI